MEDHVADLKASSGGKLKDVPPRYPEAAKEIGAQECQIAPGGKVASVRVLRGVYKILDDAAVEAVRQWEYTPTLLEGKPVPVTMTVTVNFRLSFGP